MAQASPATKGGFFSDLRKRLSFSSGSPKPVGPSDAVLVVGASGRLGREVVQALLASGRNAVAAARSEDRVKEALAAVAKDPNLYVKAGLDITLGEPPQEYFEGVTQVVSCLGPSFSDAALNSEVIDYRGNAALLTACQRAGLGNSAAIRGAELDLVTFNRGGQSTSSWSNLDDVIMGGKSSSGWQKEPTDGEYSKWQGELVVEGGGFCGTVIKQMNFDTAGYDGMRLSVRGDGSRYKFRLKPGDMAKSNELQYQASFDTVAGQWVIVDLPFEAFTAVRRNDVLYSAPEVNKGPAGTKMSSVGLVLSRFEYNEWPNPRCQPGPFELDVRSIGMYRSPRPALVLVSSAGTERFNRLTPEERKKDIPIVQLNPQSILNWKYKAEVALRYSGLPYAVVRACGLLPQEKADGPRSLQCGQTDRITGRITRREVGTTVAACLNSPHATGKTFEVRRDESEDGTGGDAAALLPHQLAALVKDSERAVTGLVPFPQVSEALPPPDKARVQEILADPRVQSQQARDGRGAD